MLYNVKLASHLECMAIHVGGVVPHLIYMIDACFSFHFANLVKLNKHNVIFLLTNILAFYFDILL